MHMKRSSIRSAASLALSFPLYFACTIQEGRTRQDAPDASPPTTTQDGEPVPPIMHTATETGSDAAVQVTSVTDNDAATGSDAGQAADAGAHATQDAAASDAAASVADGSTATGDGGAVDGGAVDGGASSSVEADASAERCEEASSTCADANTVSSCSGPDAERVLFTCTNGCDHALGGCKPTQLDTGWSVYQFALADDAIQTPASYAFEQDGLVAIQTANPMASAYVKDQELANAIIKGSISVSTSSDDDYFGFVFGWQDPEHFYLLDWKQAQQNDSACGQAEAGFALKVVSSDEELTSCADLWAAAGTERVVPLSSATDNPEGWVENVTYDFTLVYRPGDIEVTIKDGERIVAEIQSTDATYPSGRFGFYNYSQEGVRYEFVSINPVAR
jgi:hypothetical protein